LVERLWDHGLRDRLRVDPSEHPLLHAEPPHNTDAVRARFTELAFESLRVPAFYLGKDPVLSCFATGRDKGLVIDAGGDVSVASCVYDGYSLRNTVVVSSLGGTSLTNDLVALTQQGGVTIRPRFDVRRTEVKPGEFNVQALNLPARDSYRRAMVHDVARDVKESLCRVAEVPWHEIANQNVPSSTYELPDGNKIEFTAQKLTLPEPLFAPVAAAAAAAASSGNGADGVQARSIPQIAVAALRRADVDVQRDVFANVVVTGGSSMLPGFSERLTHELRDACAPQTFKLKMIAAGFAAERRFSVWIGGSILASLGTFQQLWISKQEYDEAGSQVVRQKCP
jgi:actin-like protein 6A